MQRLVVNPTTAKRQGEICGCQFGPTHFVISVAFCNKALEFCNKKPDVFCNNVLPQFVVK